MPSEQQKTAMMITPAQIRKIKLLQRQLGLEEEDYRAMLRSVAGVGSCTELTGAKVDKVIRHLERGKKSDWGPGARGQKNKKLTTENRLPTAEPMATQEQKDKIWALWNEVSRAPVEKRKVALQFFLLKRFRISAMNWLTLETAVKVIEGLKKMAERA